MASTGAPSTSRYLGRNRRQRFSPSAIRNMALAAAPVFRSSPSRAASRAARVPTSPEDGVAAPARASSLILTSAPRISPGHPLDPRVEPIVDPVGQRKELLVVFDHHTQPPDHRIEPGRFGGAELLIVQVRVVHHGGNLVERRVGEPVLMQ